MRGVINSLNSIKLLSQICAKSSNNSDFYRSLGYLRHTGDFSLAQSTGCYNGVCFPFGDNCSQNTYHCLQTTRTLHSAQFSSPPPKGMRSNLSAITPQLLCNSRFPSYIGLSSGVQRQWRCYSSSNQDNDEEPKGGMKGLIVHVPNPLHWLRNLCLMIIIQKFVDPSFNISEFLIGAKQALSYLTRLIVMKDFDTMKTVASKEVVQKLLQMVKPWSDDQHQAIEILLDDINHARATVTSVTHHESTYHVGVEFFCLAVKSYKSRNLLIQMTLKFSRQYNEVLENPAGNWVIVGIKKLNIQEIIESSDHQPK